MKELNISDKLPRVEGIELIDTHCHLDISPLERDVDKIIKNASYSGVMRMITIGIDLMSSVAAIELASNYDQVYAAIGVHPHDASTFSPRLADELVSMAQNPKVVAWGEIGLDYAKNYSARPVQHDAFDEQLELAIQLNLPVIIHDREAHEDIFDILSLKKGRIKGVIHCFSGNKEWAKKFLDLDFYISFTGVITFKNASSLREVVKYCPLDRIMVETDSPFLAPVPVRGKVNQPAYVYFVAQKVSELKGCSLKEVAQCTTQNAKDLFGL